MSSLTPLFLDNHLLVLDKPWGLLTQPSGTAEDSLEAQGKAFLKERFQKPGAVFLEAVHRIDRAVGGVVLFARTSKALSRLNDAQRSGKLVKLYRARVSGQPQDAQGVLEDWLIHDDFQARLAAPNAPGGEALPAGIPRDFGRPWFGAAGNPSGDRAVSPDPRAALPCRLPHSR